MRRRRPAIGRSGALEACERTADGPAGRSEGAPACGLSTGRSPGGQGLCPDASAGLGLGTTLGMLVEKWQALGNDFLLAWDRNAVSPVQAARLCHRQLGAGGDGVLFLRRQGDQVAVRLFNQDGSTAEFSGNGFRCAVASAFMRKRPRGRLVLASGRLLLQGHLEGDEPVLAFEPRSFGCESGPAPRELTEGGPLEGLIEPARVFCVRVGNPHLVLLVDDLDRFRSPQVDEILDRLREPGCAFPAGINVSVVQQTARGRCRLNTWERGVGFTQACASAATAAFYLLRRAGSPESLLVDNPGGTLRIFEDDGKIHLQGSARRVYTAMVDPVEPGPF